MNFEKHLSPIAAIFSPPFKGLAMLVWLYFVWCFLVYPNSGILRGYLPDPDDYMYLSHTIDWLKGQSWYDLIQYRVDPPEGVPIHFSRITEMPLAALIQFFRLFGFDWTVAATITAAVWPLVLLAVLFVALRWTAESFIPRDWARATAYVFIFTTALTFKLSMGQVDHHGLAAVILIMSLGCIARMMKFPNIVKWGAWAGFFLALGMTIALETLPWLLLLSAWVGCWMMANGRGVSRSGVVFGLTLYIASAVFLAITLPFASWAKPIIFSYSVVYVFLAGAIAVCCTGVAMAAQTRYASPRYVAGALLGIISAYLFFRHFPELLAGPYGAIDERLVKIYADQIVEMLPLSRREPSVISLLLNMALPLMGLVFSFKFMMKSEDENTWLWLLSGLLLIAAILLTTYYQSRFRYIALLFSIVPVTEFLRRSLLWAKTKWRGRKLVAAELVFLLIAGPLPMVLLPATVDGRSFNKGVLLFPAVQEVNRCEDSTLYTILNNPKSLGNRSRSIMNTIDEGSELIFRTNHKVFSAPYNNTRGNLDAIEFFSTRYPEEAKKLARERKIDLIVMCRYIPRLYLGVGPNRFYQINGKTETLPDASFAERLIFDTTPDWARRVEMPMNSKHVVFEVLPEK